MICSENRFPLCRDHALSRQRHSLGAGDALHELGIEHGVGRNPKFHYNSDLFWDAKDPHSKEVLPPGPNSPVGVVWIDLSKEHYGIHGTPEPNKVGHVESHGCIRLTNWDALELASLVHPGTAATLEE